MGLFNKKEKNLSPSGYFTADPPTPAEEKDERTASRRSEDSTGSQAKRDSKSYETRDHERAVDSKTPNLRDAEIAGAAAAGTTAAGTAASHEHKHTRANEHEHEREGYSTDAAPVVATESSRVTEGSVGGQPAVTSEHKTAVSTIVPTGTGAGAGTGSELERGVSPSGASTVKESAMPPHGHHPQPAADAALSLEDAAAAQHDHKYLKPVVHERRHIHEVEELERLRTVDRHVHHVQTHIQPLVDERHLEEVHSYREVPVTHVEERHANSPEEAALLARLNAQSISTYTVVPHDRVKIDRGETQVTENVIHHYHTIVQPVWQRDLHEFYRLSSTFTPQTMISPDGKPLSHTAMPSSTSNIFPTVAHPAGAPVVPGGPSMTGIPAAREGHKLVPDTRREVGGEPTKYEVEFVNREPIFASTHRAPMPAGNTGMVGATNVQRGPSVRTTGGNPIPSTVPGAGGFAHGARDPRGATGLEQGVRDMNVGSAR